VNKTAWLILLVAVFIIGTIAIFVPDYESPRIVKFLVISQILFALSIVIFAIGRKMDFDGTHRRLFQVILLLALVVRIVMLVGASDKYYLSDDVYRYVWDGKVNANGINPYRYAPPDSALASLQDSTIYPHINHRRLPTIYPPLAQNVFLTTYVLGGGTTWGFKLLAVLMELLTVVALLRWMRQTGIPRSHILLWLFSPLILTEFYLSTHVDIVALPFLVATLITINDRRPIMAGMLLALAILVKLSGLLFAPFVMLHFAGRERTRFALALAATLALSYAPYVIGSEGKYLGSLFSYLETWQYNASVFFVFKYALGLEWARYLVAGLLLAWLAYLAVARLDCYQKMFRAYGGYLVLTTTFFPWYFVWIYPFVLRNLSPAFVFLSGSVLLSYHVHIGYYDGGSWSPMPWLGILSYLPFYVLLAMSGMMRTRKDNRCR
jgi:hypothetical protein